MAKCRSCGREINKGRKLCYLCLNKWKNKRILAYKIAKKELGKIFASNKKEFSKRLKEIEKDL